MKIRIKDDSIRLRLTQTEVKQLVDDRKVNSNCCLSLNTIFSYSIESGDAWYTEFLNNEIVIQIPSHLLINWDTNQEVGFETIIDNGSNGLKLLIEKDFKCLTPRDENEDDHYQNPLNQHNC
jgi:hypothetical protein